MRTTPAPTPRIRSTNCDRDFGVIAGHGRLIAAKEEGIAEVPCVFADHLTEAQKKAYILADNRMALDAGWDEDVLRAEIEALKEMDFDPLLTGFDERELGDLFDDRSEAVEDDFEVELPEEAKTKPGDVYVLGRHRLICGDATKAEDVERLMGEAKADLYLTDPPYNVDYTGKTKESLKIQNDKMLDDDFRNFLVASFGNAKEALKRGGRSISGMPTQRGTTSAELATTSAGK